MKNRLQHYERSYQKLQDILSKIGGFGKTTFLIASTINLIVYKYIVILDIEDFLLSINKIKNNININNTTSEFDSTFENKKIFFPKFQKEENKNKILEQKIQDKELSIIKPRKHNKTDITNVKDDPIWNNNFNKEYNFKKASYLETEEFINKPIEKNNFCWLQYIWHMICCDTINKNIAYYENFRKRIISEENMIISHSNLYKAINILGLDSHEDLIFDKQYTTIFY